MIDLDAIEARANAATAGPWSIDYIEHTGEHGILINEPDGTLGCAGRLVANWLTYSNAEFVAHAREDIPALIEEIRRLRAAVGLHCRDDQTTLCMECHHVWPCMTVVESED